MLCHIRAVSVNVHKQGVVISIPIIATCFRSTVHLAVHNGVGRIIVIIVWACIVFGNTGVVIVFVVTHRVGKRQGGHIIRSKQALIISFAGANLYLVPCGNKQGCVGHNLGSGF